MTRRRPPDRWKGGVIPLVVALMACGCTGANSRPATKSSRPALAAGPTSPTSAVRLGPWRLSIEDAQLAKEGAQYDVLFRQPNQLPGGANQGVLAMLPGPRLLTTFSPASQGTTIVQSRIMWTGSGPNGVIHEPAVPGPARQTIYGSADAGGQAWVETASTDLDHQDWRVFYHPNGGSTQLVGDSATAFPGQRMYIPGGWNPITLTSSDVVWSTSDIRPGGKSVASDLMVASRTHPGRPRILVRDAGLPAAVGSDLFYVSMSHYLPARFTTTYRIEELVGGRRTLVRSGVTPERGRVVELAASRDYLAWTWAPADETVNATIFVLDRHTGSLGSIGLAPLDWSAQLNIAGRLLVWGNGSSNGEGGEYLLDLASRHLWKLGSSAGYSVAFAAGRDVVWAYQAAGNIGMIAGRWR